MPSRRSILRAAGVSLAASAFPKPLIAQAKEKVVVSWLPIMQTFAYYVALEERLFEEAGLEIAAIARLRDNGDYDEIVDKHLSRFWITAEHK